jgi:uncharacterized protein YajQ (UPF0234 family)
MADEHSFDIASKIDLQEVLNAEQQATKEISQRFDFKGSKSSIELNKEKHEITLISDDELKLKTVIDILQTKLVKRGISLKALGTARSSRHQATACGGDFSRVFRSRNQRRSSNHQGYEDEGPG